jgi:hypothetical protein
VIGLAAAVLAYLSYLTTRLQDQWRQRGELIATLRDPATGGLLSTISIPIVARGVLQGES